MRRWLRRGRLDAERAREMQAHIDHLVDDLVSHGCSRDAAIRQAHRRFGNATRFREEIYRMNSVPLLEPLLRDVRYAFRMLRKTPGFTAIAVTILAVGIGVNAAVFSVVNALLLRPLPYPDPHRLATMRVSGQGARGEFSRDAALDGATFLAIRDNAKLIDVAAQGPGGWGGGVNMVAGTHAANVDQARVSAGYFRVLGVAPFIGREFSPDDDREGAAPVAILSHGLWARAFASDPAVVGRAIMLRGEPYIVTGVMPASFASGAAVDVWTPLRPSRSGEGGGTNYSIVARLRPGASWSQASAEIDRIASPVFRPQFGKNVTALSCSLIPLQTGNTTGIREPLIMLWGAVGLVLLIACVNLAGLLLARSGARTREIATRLALGSGRTAVIRQLLAESGVLGFLGALAGLGLGWLILQELKELSAGVIAVGYPIEFDGRVLGATLFAALLTSTLFGLVPALQSSRLDVQRTLVESSTRSVAGGTQRSRRLLVVAEVAMGVVLLVGAGLLVRTFVELKGLSPGFDPANVLTATVSLQDARYREAGKVAALFDESLARITRYPGVSAAGVTLGLPYTRLLNMGVRPLDGNVSPDKPQIANVSYITPGFFSALNVPLKSGRDFSGGDRSASAPVAIVNQEFARRYYETAGALGRRVRVMGADRLVVGVVGNTRSTTSGFQGYTDPLVTPPIVYVPATQVSGESFRLIHTWFSPAWVVKASGPVEGVGRGIREAIAAVDPLLPISRLEAIADVQASSLSAQRLMASLVAGLGAVALLLAAVGIYGMIASSVTERTRELGVRLALGASPGQVLRNVVLPGMITTAAGIGIGGVASLFVVRLMQSFIWGVTPTDPLTFIAVVLTLLAVALIAAVVPALRVLRLDPALTLRAE